MIAKFTKQHLHSSGLFRPKISILRLKIPTNTTALKQPPLAQTTDILEKLDNEQAAAWSECSSFLQSSLGIEEDKANQSLSKAFGWSGQGFWRQEMIEQPPSLQSIQAAIEFLNTLGIEKSEDHASLIVKFPEVLALDVSLMNDNVSQLKSRFFLKGTALANAIKRKPRVLGAVVDCEGNCAGYCTRCFAQF